MKSKQMKAADNNVMVVSTPALDTTLREMPMLGLERLSARCHGWVVARMPTGFLTLNLVCLNRL